MAKKDSNVARKVWRLLRVAFLRTRKGGVFKRRLLMELPKFLKSLGQTTTHCDQIRYGERQLSFDKTPVFHVKMNRPDSMRFNIPCITPQVDFDYDFDDVSESCYDEGRVSFLKDSADQGQEYSYEYNECEDDEGIDLRAEKFIAKFYEQMKLQRQISYLEYHETPTKHKHDS